MGNEKTSITAEFVSIIRAKKDSKNLYFISKKGRRLYGALRKLVSKKKLEEIFDWRLKLSEQFDKKIAEEKPEQIIELAAGYSLRGFNLCLENKNIVYIDSDFESVLTKKNLVLRKICEAENITYPENYFLASVDVLKDDIFEKIKNNISKDKKTLIIAEGLTSYFSDAQFEKFLENIAELLADLSQGEFYSQEKTAQPIKGIGYRVLRNLFVSTITRSKERRGFKSAEEFENYLRKNNVANLKIHQKQNEALFYSIFNS
jgi:O-methyltransferase involved in polyketide biosynthesis